MVPTEIFLARMSETPEARLKRLTMRSWRRGMREVDLVLGPFAEANLRDMSDEDLERYEHLLSQNDQDIYAWITGAAQAPGELSTQVSKIVDFLSVERGTTFN